MTKILTIGDSITAAGQWQAELVRLGALVDVCLDIVNVGVAGVRTTFWPDKVGDFMATYAPDVVTFFTGTNDDPHETRYGEPATCWAWRYCVEQIHNSRPGGVPIIPAFIQYSDPLIAPTWLLDAEPVTNDCLYREITRPGKTGWFPGIADFQKIPSTADYLDDGGIHPNARGYAAMGRIVYDAAQQGLGWPPCPEPPLRGMYGHRKGYPRPSYIP